MTEAERPRLAVISQSGTGTIPADPGGFGAVVNLVCPEAAQCFADALRRACELAEANGCDWMIVLAPGETLLPDALALVAPAIESHDAVFGAIRVAGGPQTVWRPSRLAFDDASRLPHALLNWWIGRTGFVRTAVVRAILGGIESASPSPRAMTPPSGLPAISPSRGEISLPQTSFVPDVSRQEPKATSAISPLEGEMAGRPEGGALGGASKSSSTDTTAALSYLFQLFDGYRCIKLAQPLFETAAEPAPLSDEDRAFVLARLERLPVFLPVRHGAETYRLPYTGRNAGIEREQTRGQFFEAAELSVIGERIGPGRRIVDIGANTGNHTIYFAGPMRAALVVPFEPLADIAAVLSRTVAANGLRNVDLSRLGVGLSDGPGRARVVRSERGGLGASRLEDDAAGEIEVMSLDDALAGALNDALNDALTQRPDFLKIDVEAMEMRVLAGAEKIIAAARPVIFIEIANDNTTAFMEWLRQRHYRIERIFSDKGHSNYLIAPDGGR